MIEIGSSMIGTATKGKVRLGCRYSMIEIGTYDRCTATESESVQRMDTVCCTRDSRVLIIL